MYKSLAPVAFYLIIGKKPTNLYLNKYITHKNIHTTRDAIAIHLWFFYIIYTHNPNNYLHHWSKTYRETSTCVFYIPYLTS